MGRSRTSKYALEMDGSTPRCWWVGPQPGGVPGSGKPTLANLTRYVEVFMRSLEPGGANAHISRALGHVPYPKWARIVMNDGSRELVVEWTAPMFMVVGPNA